MSTGEVIAKLEALLARVQRRAAEPRRAAAPAAVAAPVAVAQVVSAYVAPVVPVVPVAPAVLPAPSPPAPPVVQAPAPEPAPVLAAMADGPELQVAEVVVSEVSEVSVDELGTDGLPPEPILGDTTESRERLIVAAPVAPEPQLELDAPLPPSAAPGETKVEATSEVEVVLDEPVEEAPVSSRRAVVVEPPERLAELAFGAEEQAPRHTPPPESGRLPAVPEVRPEHEGDITGVREAASIAMPIAAKPIFPEVTPARLAPSDAVAEVLPPARSFTPATFLELLDASLGL